MDRIFLLQKISNQLFLRFVFRYIETEYPSLIRLVNDFACNIL
jgi:hypothetical protein